MKLGKMSRVLSHSLGKGKGPTDFVTLYGAENGLKWPERLGRNALKGAWYHITSRGYLACGDAVRESSLMS